MLYHYTSFKGLEGILSNRELWMTSHNFLNDTQEYIEGFNRIRKIVKECIKSSKLNELQIEGIEQTLEWLDNTILLVTSFSRAKDRKSQWDYGDYSIEFDEDLLKTSNHQGVIQALRSCLYDVQEKDRQARLIGETYIKALPEKPRIMDFYHLFIGYMEYLTRAKNEHFFEEEETRLSYYMHKNNIDLYAVKNGEISSYRNGTGLLQGPVKVFSSVDTFQTNGKIYCKYPLNIQAIKSIIISRKIPFEENKQDIVNLLKKLDLDIPIYQSQIPFRS